LLWVEIRERVSAIEVARHTIISVPPNTLIRTPKMNRGKCYTSAPSLSATNLDLIYYFKEVVSEKEFYLLKVHASIKTVIKNINSQRDGRLLGLRARLEPKQTGDTFSSCLEVDFGYYLSLEDTSHSFVVILNEETMFGRYLQTGSSLSHTYKYIPLYNFTKPKENDEVESDFGYLMTELIACSAGRNKANLTGWSSRSAISAGTPETFVEVYEKYGVKVGLSKIPRSGEFFIRADPNVGSEPLNYTLRMHQTPNSSLPHFGWDLVGDVIVGVQVL
jgi:hypothetical protein